MDEHGDIPSRGDVIPARTGEPSGQAQFMAGVVEDILDNGGVAHVYLGHSDEDYHLQRYNTHVWPTIGMIYFHANDRDHWINAEQIEMIERHYE